MKDYLLSFRDQAFQASFKLYRRILPGSFVATILIGLILLFIVTPLTLLAMGYGATEFFTYQQDMHNLQRTIVENQQDIEAISAAYTAQFSNMQMALVLPLFIVVILVYSWACNFYLTLSNNEIRTGSTRVFSALRESFSGKVIKIAAFFILYVLIQISVTLIFGLIFYLLSTVSSILAVFVGFIGFFVVLAFLLRFSIAIPAIVHGEMGTVQAIAFSLSRITWKRGGMLLLLSILSLLLLIIFAIILGGLLSSSDSTELSVGSFIGQQISSLIMSILFVTYFVSAMSTLYFRYSDDSTEDDTEHLIEL
ncbi:MAG: hypothetical protein ACKOXF_03620 [Chitinophagaceae bacterium]